MNNDRYVLNQPKLRSILEDKNISSAAKLLLFILIHRLGGKNYCFPSQVRMAQDIGLSPREIRNLLNILSKNGIISITRGSINPKTKEVINSNTYDLSNILIKVL